MLRTFDPRLADKPQLRENSFNRILRLEATYARFFWPRYFSALSTDLFEREHRKQRIPSTPRSITATDFSTMPSSGRALLPVSILQSASSTNCVAAVPASCAT